MDIVPFLIGLCFLMAASWSDLRTREVPDLLSYGLIVFAAAYGLAETIILWNWQPFLAMAAGELAMLLLGLLMFYGGQWGGADSKLLIGLGGLYGLWLGRYALLLYLVVALFAGAAYGILYTAGLALRHRAAFLRKFRTLLREPKVHLTRKLVIGAGFLLLLLAFLLAQFRLLLFVVAIVAYCAFYLWLGVRTVEDAILIKEYPVAKLREGDWIKQDVVVKGERVCGPKDLGISVEQIALLKKLKVKKVLVKEGIPFVPSFLLGYLLLLLVQPFVAAVFSSLL